MSKATAQTHLSREIDFNSLSQGQKRVLIATDALAQIELGNWKPTERVYWAPTVDPKGAKDNPVRYSNGCQVCALGACFISSFVRTPHDTADLRTRSYGYQGREFGVLSGAGEASQALGSRLLQFFDEKTIGLMEIAFEGATDISPMAEDTYQHFTEEASDAIAWGKQHSTPKERLVAILRNVIDNCGEFKP